MSRRKQIDPETNKLLSDGEELERMTQSRGWGIAKKILSDKLLSVGNIFDIGAGKEGVDPKAISIEVSARQMAIEVIMDWLTDVEGSVSQYQETAKRYAEMQKESHVYHVPDYEDVDDDPRIDR